MRERDGREVYPLDQDFLDDLKEGLPPCAGVAIGIDRLIMVLVGADHITEVVPFSEERPA